MHLKRRLSIAAIFAAGSLAMGASLVQAADVKPLIKIGYVEGWSDSVATTFVAAQAIREKLGYEVKLIPVSAGLMWQAVACGDLDATMSAWLPGTHSAYYEKFKDKVLVLGSNTPTAKIGLIVPEYVTAVTIADLQAQKAEFEGRIVGIDAGAGVMTKTEQAIKIYGLDYKLIPSSGTGMAAELERSIRNKKAIVVTGWMPHWMFAKWKLKFLEDPQKVYGDAEHVDSVANPGLPAKAKAVSDFLKNFSWKPGEIDAVMLSVENGEKAEAAAQQWLNAHPARLQEWLAAPK